VRATRERKIVFFWIVCWLKQRDVAWLKSMEGKWMKSDQTKVSLDGNQTSTPPSLSISGEKSIVRTRQIVGHETRPPDRQDTGVSLFIGDLCERVLN
jgi:hypothetical protein